jgi:hypothetical protein
MAVLVGFAMMVALGPSAAEGAEPARGDRLRLALIDPPERLAEALRAGMAAWGVSVVVVVDARQDHEPARGAVLLDDDGARAIAAELRAGAVVWVSGGEAPELWVLDLARPQATHRPLGAPPPFDDATAAAAALSLKTLLRNGGLDPETRATVRETGGDVVVEAPPLRPTRAAQVWPRVQLAARTDYHYLGIAEVRVGGEVAVDTGVRVRGDHPLQIVVAISAGPGVAIDSPMLVGHFHALGIRAAARVADRRGVVIAALSAGALLEHTRIDGLLANGDAAEAVRDDPGLFLEGSLAVAVRDRLHLGLDLGLAAMLTNHRYTVENRPVIKSRAALGWVGMRIAIGL